LDFIPIEKTSDSNKVTKAYGKGLPEDELNPSWDVQSPLNGMSICYPLEKSLGNSEI
jgi:hypothetical protein